MTMWSDFDHQVGYHYEFDASRGYENMVQKAEPLYRSDPEKYYLAFLHFACGLIAFRAAGLFG